MPNVLEVVQNQGPNHFTVRGLRRHLEQQTFFDGAGADSGRVKLLHHVKGCFDLGCCCRRLAGASDVFEWRVNAAVFVNVRNYETDQAQLNRRGI
jgi:hypothetical protein